MDRQSRRGFLKSVGTGACAFALAPVAEASSGAEAHVNNEELGMLYDATKCVGCKACMSACKRVNNDGGNLECDRAKFDKNETPLWDAPEDLSGNNRTIIKLYKESGKPWSYVKFSCMHCQNPACVSVCPVSALTKDKQTGVVDYNKSACVGCRYCQLACPFNIPKFQWDRAIPQIVKCNFCKNTYLKEKGITACADACPTGAILFGKRMDLLQEARKRLQANPSKYIPTIYGEKEVGGSNHLYLAGVPFAKLGLPALPEAAPTRFSEKIMHTIYKGFVAPVALYAAICLIAMRNLRHDKSVRHTTGTGEE
jgi:Fe-S-cluster-containing dehydrogenase component